MKSKGLKRFLSAALCATMVLGLTACGGGSSSKSTSAGKSGKGDSNTIRIWMAGTGDATMNDTYRKVFDNWVKEKGDGTKYELTFVAWSEYFSKLSVALSSGEGPDLYMTGYGQLGSMQAQGYVEPLDDYIPKDWDGYTDIPENILEAGKVDGKRYGLLIPNTRVLLYRKDIAEKNGVTQDDLTVDSLDDLTNLSRKMAVYDDKGNLQTAGLEIVTAKSGGIDSLQAYSFIVRNFAQDQDLWNKDGSADFNNEAGLKTVQYWKDLYDSGISFGTDPSATTSGIVTGTAAMAVSAESIYGSANAAFPDQIGLVDSSLNTLLIGNFMAVNSGSANKDKAADMLLYMFNSDSLKAQAEGLGQYPIRNSLKDWYVQQYPQFAPVAKAFEHSYLYSPQLIPNFNEAKNTFDQSWEQMMVTGADAKALLAQEETDWNNVTQKK